MTTGLIVHDRKKVGKVFTELHSCVVIKQKESYQHCLGVRSIVRLCFYIRVRFLLALTMTYLLSVIYHTNNDHKFSKSYDVSSVKFSCELFTKPVKN